MTTETMDQQDWKSLLLAILDQSIDDYIKLQHPITRQRKYLQESYLTAIAFLFDPDYELENIADGFNGHMNIEGLVKEILDSERVDMKKLQAHTVEQTLAYWEGKQMNIFTTIPDTVNICGFVYSVHQGDKLRVNDSTRVITLDKKSETAESQLLYAMLTAICLEEDIELTTSKLKKLNHFLYMLLKMNNCFTPLIRNNQKSES